MKGQKQLFSSASDEWATPQDFFDRYNDLYKFTLDCCATADNAKCDRFFTLEDDGLAQPWSNADGSPAVVWCNPPYSRIGQWVEKANRETVLGRASFVVMLIPARTDTRWFHEFIYGNQDAFIQFVKGRLKFGDSKNSAPFPSMVVSFRHRPIEVMEAKILGAESGKPISFTVSYQG